MRADIHGGQEHKRSVQGPDTEAQDLSPPNPHFPLATRGRSIQKCQFQTSEVRQEEEDAFTTPGETYLILSQTRTPTPASINRAFVRRCPYRQSVSLYLEKPDLIGSGSSAVSGNINM